MAATKQGVVALASACKAEGVPLDLNQRIWLNGGTAVEAAIHMGNHAVVAALVELGANLDHTNFHGGTLWTSACNNVRTSVATLELIFTASGGKGPLITQRMRPTRPMWHALDFFFQTVDMLRRPTLDYCVITTICFYVITMLYFDYVLATCSGYRAAQWYGNLRMTQDRRRCTRRRL